MASEKLKTRRRYGADLRAQVLAQCGAAGASVAKVAMAHGINANVVHRWRQLAREAASSEPATALSASTPVGGFVPVALPAPPSMSVAPPPPAADIRVELRRGTTTMRINWPSTAAEQFADFTRDLLK
jgi:transposase